MASFELGKPIPTTAGAAGNAPRGKGGTMPKGSTHTERVHLTLEVVVEIPDKAADADRRAAEIRLAIVAAVDALPLVYTDWTRAIEWERAHDDA